MRGGIGKGDLSLDCRSRGWRRGRRRAGGRNGQSVCVSAWWLPLLGMEIRGLRIEGWLLLGEGLVISIRVMDDDERRAGPLYAFYVSSDDVLLLYGSGPLASWQNSWTIGASRVP